MQPKESLPLTQFHDWYNNEHGPTRLRLPFIPNGFRYRATDLPDINSGSQSLPEWMACYDITDMYELTQEPYMRLRGPPAKSQREIDTMKQIFVDRKLLDLVGEDVNQEQFSQLESPHNFDKNAEGNVLVAVSLVVDSSVKPQVDKWYSESEIPKIKAFPGWRRTRRYTTSHIEARTDGKVEYLTIHEFIPGTDANKLDISKTASFDITEAKVRNYTLVYTFGAAPRHLSGITSWTSTDGLTKTIPSTSPGFGAAIESYVTTPDNCILPYRLEGNTSNPDSPVIVLVNSVLVTYGIWDSFISHFFSHAPNRKYRVLRYLSRGRSSNTGATTPVTVNLLSSDIIHLLNTLRIPTAACLIGVSLGGATALATALTHPSRIQSFISCDTSAKSPAGNSEAWGSRIAVAEKQGSTANLISPFGDQSPSAPAEPIVGTELAEMTVRRWFAPTSYEDPALTSEFARVKHMVTTNSLPGFKKGVEALFDYDYKPLLPGYTGKGAFLVGAKDGVLPKAMEALSKELGTSNSVKVGFQIVDDAGHLPMCEKPGVVADYVTRFLEDDY
ncbi:putative alpha beta hydrolase [Phaeomoniella chlamydospora]|uniref:Putative alpha beta hydrolase n=1 Tax=Phaeomoniella chlamydospora TaxID=158046 RepID=A0A0G2E5Z8_PHACM|nr:putative alpha beta hydrolase [Phaeomoniella chlamydospora]